MEITRKSAISGKTNTLDIPITELELALIESKADHIQKIIPHISAPLREFIKTGITPEEWTNTFGSTQ